ncbi:hypothetical protein ACN24M_03135 [Streptomyces microflavus]|uniref:hypothetical protein n=1 Tax=Streptomyces microflavus TaxID=1919 RepID=UPI003B2218E2
MIRAGRGHLVRTLADLAAQQGVSSQRYRKLKPYEAAGFPERISSARARTRLYDGEQVDAYLLGKPVPSLPERDDDNDLLDRQECAAELGVSPRSWDAYKNDPLLTGHMAKVGGVEHWPRGIVHQFHNSRPGKATMTGRPKGAGDQIPRDQLPALTAQLVDTGPTTSAAGVVQVASVVTDSIGKSVSTPLGELKNAKVGSDSTLSAPSQVINRSSACERGPGRHDREKAMADRV